MENINLQLIDAVVLHWRQISQNFESGQYKNLRVGSPPDEMYLQQFEFDSTDWERGRISVDRIPIRMWLLTSTELIEKSPCGIDLLDSGEIDGMYYQRGRFQFALSEEQTRVLIGWQVGPRYGRGYIVEIERHDGKPLLSEKKQPLWVS